MSVCVEVGQLLLLQRSPGRDCSPGWVTQELVLCHKCPFCQGWLLRLERAHF